MIEKEEITSTEFPEGGNTTSTKGPPASQRGEKAKLAPSYLEVKAIKGSVSLAPNVFSLMRF